MQSHFRKFDIFIDCKFTFSSKRSYSSRKSLNYINLVILIMLQYKECSKIRLVNRIILCNYCNVTHKTIYLIENILYFPPELHLVNLFKSFSIRIRGFLLVLFFQRPLNAQIMKNTNWLTLFHSVFQLEKILKLGIISLSSCMKFKIIHSAIRVHQ